MGDQDEAAQAQAEAEIEQAIEPMTEEQKSQVNMATVADVSMALRQGYLSKFEATKTLQAAGMTRKHAERLVKLEAQKANVLRTEDDLYASADEAEKVAKLIGCEGHHTHEVNGRTMFMPCSDMKDYTALTGERHESDDDLELVDDKALEDIDLKPTSTMADLAARGLELREEHGRGGTEVGVARARDIKNRDNLSPETVGRMVNFFSRHRVDLDAPAAKPGHKDYPSAGVIAWLLWGGDPADPDGGGHAWAKRKKEQIDREREGQKGGGVTGLVPKIWGTQLSANARTALGRLILEKSDNCGTRRGVPRGQRLCGRSRAQSADGINQEQKDEDLSVDDRLEAHLRNAGNIDNFAEKLSNGELTADDYYDTLGYLNEQRTAPMRQATTTRAQWEQFESDLYDSMATRGLLDENLELQNIPSKSEPWPEEMREVPDFTKIPEATENRTLHLKHLASHEVILRDDQGEPRCVCRWIPTSARR